MIALFDISILIAVTILGIIVPVFVFATTLLGSAARRLISEENEAKGQDRKEFEKDIKELQAEIDEAKKSGPTPELNKRMLELVGNREKFDRQFKKLQSKYDSIKFKGIVVYPGLFMLLSIISAVGAKIYFNENLFSCSLLGFLYLVSLIIGLRQLCMSLLTIQEVAISSDELRLKEQTDSFIEAFKKHDESKEAELKLKFVNITFPYKCKISTEITINFKVWLIKGKIIRNVSVWFFVPDGFDLIKPNYFWRQSQDFKKYPNIRTVKVRIGDVSVGTSTPDSLKIKTPPELNKYTLWYSLKGDGYDDGKHQEVILEVEK